MTVIRIICPRCGGYGVLCHPESNPEAEGVGTKHACTNCGGDGWLAGVAREEWKPDPAVLALLDSYRWR